MEAARKIAVVFLRIFGVCALCTVMLGCVYLLENRGVKQEAQVIFVGTQEDADCSVLLSGEACVVIDTGEDKDAVHILEVLQENQVDKIDCLILTHPDKDHIGGAFYLLDHVPVEEVITPCYEGEKPLYKDLMERLETEHIPTEALSRDRLFTFGALDIRIFPPEDFHYEKSNDYSLAALVKHGDVTLFFAGDAEKERLGELLKLDLPQVNVYKTAHHGRNSKRGVKLIEELKPEYAVVTAQEPEDEIREAFRVIGTKVLTTVTQDIRFVSDGKKISPETEKRRSAPYNPEFSR